MMRIGLIVVGLGALTAAELGTPARTKTSAPDPFEQLVDASISRDTLRTADRLEVHRLQHEAPVQPISPVRPTPPSDLTAIMPQEDSSTAENYHGANNKRNVVRKLKPKPKHTDRDRPKSKSTNSYKVPKTDRSKAMVELKPCRANAFDGLLQALKLSSRCQT